MNLFSQIFFFATCAHKVVILYFTMNSTAFGHMNPYSSRTMWKTAVNVFNEAKKGGVELDFKTYQAIMHSLTVHTRKRDSCGGPFRHKKTSEKSTSVDISSVPSLGLWKAVKKNIHPHDRSPHVASPKFHNLSLGQAPRPKPRSLITELTNSRDAVQQTPSIFQGSIFVRNVEPPPVNSESEIADDSNAQKESLKLHIPGMVKLMQSKKDRLVALRSMDRSEKMQMDAYTSQAVTSANDPESSFRIVDPQGIKEASSNIQLNLLNPRNSAEILSGDPILPISGRDNKPLERHRTSLNLDALPEDELADVNTDSFTNIEESHLSPDIHELTDQWEKRREEETREQERLAAIAFEQEERKRALRESQEKNNRWVQERGALHSNILAKTQIEPIAYKLAFSPSDEMAWKTFQASKDTNNLTAEHVRIMLQRQSANNSLDSLSKILAEVRKFSINGVDSYLRYYNLLLEYQTGGYSRVTELFTEMESKVSRVNKRAIILTMLSSVRCDNSSGWQRATEIYCKYKPITNDPLCMMELNYIQSLCMSNMRSKDVRVKVLDAVRSVHSHLRNSMNHIGKLHSSALIRAYVKAGDSGTAHSILKGFQSQGDADQTMYAGILSSCSNENIQDIIATFIDGKEVIESDLLAAIMCTFANRQLVHESWSILVKAKANQEFQIRGARLAYAVLHCIEAEENASESHVKEAHHIILKCGLYNDRTFHRIVPFFKHNEMNNELVQAIKALKKTCYKNIAPAHIAAYQQACKNVKIDCVAVDTEAQKSEGYAFAAPHAPNSIKEQTHKSVGKLGLPGDFDEKLMHLAKCGDWRGATAIVTEMGNLHIKPKTFQYNCVLTAAKDHCNIVDKILKHMSDFHVEPNTMTINLAMNAYSRMQMWDQMKKVYRDSKATMKDLTTYNLAINAIGGEEGDWKESMNILQEIRQRNIRPSQQTIDSIFDKVAPFSWIEGLRVLQLTKNMKGIAIQERHKEVLVRCIAQSGIANAAQIIDVHLADRKKKNVSKKNKSN